MSSGTHRSLPDPALPRARGSRGDVVPASRAAGPGMLHRGRETQRKPSVCQTCWRAEAGKKV